MSRLIPLTNAMVQILYRHRYEVMHLSGYDLVESLPRKGVLEFESDPEHRTVVKIEVVEEITYERQCNCHLKESGS